MVFALQDLMSVQRTTLVNNANGLTEDHQINLEERDAHRWSCLEMVTDVEVEKSFPYKQ